MTVPTPDDIRRASLRQSIAARFRREFVEAKTLCEREFGPGWVPQGRQMLVTHAEAARSRNTGERPVPAATVLTTEKGGRQ